eukprot:ctg_253.g151
MGVLLLAHVLPFASAVFIPDMTPETFDQYVKKRPAGTIAAVKVYAPWCQHCQTMEDDWNILGNLFADTDEVVVASVNGDKHVKLRESLGTTGYPSIYLYGADGAETPRDWKGGRQAGRGCRQDPAAVRTQLPGKVSRAVHPGEREIAAAGADAGAAVAHRARPQSRRGAGGGAARLPQVQGVAPGVAQGGGIVRGRRALALRGRVRHRGRQQVPRRAHRARRRPVAAVAAHFRLGDAGGVLVPARPTEEERPRRPARIQVAADRRRAGGVCEPTHRYRDHRGWRAQPDAHLRGALHQVEPAGGAAGAAGEARGGRVSGA